MILGRISLTDFFTVLNMYMSLRLQLSGWEPIVRKLSEEDVVRLEREKLSAAARDDFAVPQRSSAKRSRVRNSNISFIKICFYVVCQFILVNISVHPNILIRHLA